MNITVNIKGEAVTVGSFYLSDAKLAKLGTDCKCTACGGEFQAGINEYVRALQDDKFRPKKKVELYTVGSEGLYPMDKEVMLQDISNVNTMSLQERAVIFGMTDFVYRRCPACFYENNDAYDPFISASSKQQSYNNSHSEK
jgi:hypothetical protein